MTLGQMIFDARLKRGLSLRGLEALSGISNPLIHQIEHGRVRDPGFRTVTRLAKALRIPLNRLAETEPEPS